MNGTLRRNNVHTTHLLRRRERGLTLIEIVFGMVLVLILAYLALTSLSSAKEKVSTHGLATAVMEEFKAARQTAIKSGQPVAVGIPTDNGGQPCATSMYRIQGWNRPYINWSVGYRGDYPGLGFAAATWAGAPGPGTPALPATAKFFNFDAVALAEWLPDDTENDYIFLYLPDGSLITNGLPSVNGEYTLVVADGPNFTGGAPAGVRIAGGDNPMVIYLSAAGGVDLATGCPGATLGAGTTPVTSTPKGRTEPVPPASQTIALSQLTVRPNPSGVPGEGICVPGQYVTLEILAYSPEGVALFANWNHSTGSVTGEKGSFTHPDGQSPVLTGEADRMEFLPYHKLSAEQRDPSFWNGYPPGVGQGVFRAQWTWTVPIVSDEGDLYTVNVNVQNASANATILNPAPPVILNPAPKGRMIVERRDPVSGLWQLWRMNPDGSAAKLLSPKGISEVMASIDRSGTKMAFLQGNPGNRYVKIRPVNGKKESFSRGPGNYTSVSLSPDGSWVSYRDDTGGPTGGTLITERVDGSVVFTKPQGWYGGGYAVKKGRTGWSWDNRYMLYGSENAIGVPRIYSVDLSNPGTPADAGVPIIGPVIGPVAHERLFCPTVYRFGGQDHVIVSCSGRDAFLLDLPLNDYTTPGQHQGQYASSGMTLYPFRPEINGPGSPGSTNLDDDYPAVSLDGTRLFVTRSPWGFGGEDTEDQDVLMIPRQGAKFIGPPQAVVPGDVRRAIFLPET